MSSALENALADRYTIQREPGRGGMATVYKQRQGSPPRPATHLNIMTNFPRYVEEQLKAATR